MITFRIEVPKNANANMRSILEKLAKEMGEEGIDYRGGMINKILGILKL